MNKDRVAIIIPTLGRPHKMQSLLDNIYSVTDRDNVDVFFVVEEEDTDSISQGRSVDASVLINQRTKNFAGAVNTAVRTLIHNYFYVGNDDFLFHDNWLPPLLNLSEHFGAVGPDDLGNPSVKAGTHATSFLVARRYIPRACIGYPKDMLFEGYSHNYCDTEFSQTAIANGEYAFCPDSVVEHIHPAFGKAETDDTYKKTSDTLNYGRDGEIFNSRQHLWQNPLRG